MGENQAAPTRFGGWRLLALTLGLVGGLIALLLEVLGTGEDGWRAVVRVTAAVSLGLFLVAYLASSLRRLRRGPATLWLLRNRRTFGLGFAVSHFCHLAAILQLSRLLQQAPRPELIVLGGVGDLLVLAMAATSFDPSVAWLGARRWNQLHTLGIHYVWGVFILTYAGAASQGVRLFPVLACAALFGALGLRIVLRVRRVARVIDGPQAG
ncbi:MAG: hypothetical protein ABFS46_03040 [Myxococcota bacterium]